MSRSAMLAAAVAVVVTVPLLALMTPAASEGLTSSTRPPTASALASWGSAEIVADETYPTPRYAMVRARNDGTAVAAWIARSDAARVVMASRRRSDGRWTAPVQLAGEGDYDSLDVAVGPRGSASVVWRQLLGDRTRVVEAHKRRGGWSPPEALGAGVLPRVTIDGRGTTTVVWPGRGIRSARRGLTGPWRDERVTEPGTAGPLRVSSNADGDVAVSWVQGYSVSSSVRPRGSTWAPRRTWRPDRLARVTGLQVAIGPSGQALVAWCTTGVWSEAAHNYVSYVAWARSTPSGTWSRFRKLTKSLGEEGGSLALSMNGSGEALAAWVQVFRTGDPSRPWAARMRPDGVWGPPLMVSAASIRRPLPFMDHRGKAHVVAHIAGHIYSFRQAAGRPWTSDGAVVKGGLFDASGRGRHLIALYVGGQGDEVRAIAWKGAR